MEPCLAKNNVHISASLFLRLHILLHIGIDIGYDMSAVAENPVERLRRELVESVVKLHYRPGTSPVRRKALFVSHRTELRLQLRIQEIPVRIPPPVNTLLHVAHDKIRVAVGHTVLQQRSEILPLNPGRILELIQQEMIEPHPQLLVYERSIASVNDAFQYGVRIIQTQHILLFHQRIEGKIQFSTESQRIYLRPKNHGRVKFHIRSFEQSTKFISLCFKMLHKREQLGIGLGEPLVFIGQRRKKCIFRQFEIHIILQVRVFLQLPESPAFTHRIGKIHTGIDKTLNYGGGDPAKLGEKLPDDGIAALFQRGKGFFRIGRGLVNAVFLDDIAVFLVFQGDGHIVQTFAHIEPASAIEVIFKTICQPAH